MILTFLIQTRESYANLNFKIICGMGHSTLLLMIHEFYF